MYPQLPGLFLFSLGGAALIFSLFLIAAPAQTPAEQAAAAKYVPVSEYDPTRDAALDIQNAISEAERTHKHVLLEVGGEWCSWCHTLDKFFQANQQLLSLRDENYLTVKINFSEGHENRKVLSRYPTIRGFPHLIFLDSHGKLLRSQDTDVLERGNSYSLKKLTATLTKWKPST
jgi:thioredoxin-related protein